LDSRANALRAAIRDAANASIKTLAASPIDTSAVAISLPSNRDKLSAVNVARFPLLLALLGVLILIPSRAGATPIDDAVAKARKYLYDTQQKDGSWETDPAPDKSAKLYGTLPLRTMWGGRTAIATYALLATGEKPNDERIVRAVAWLKDHGESAGSYVLCFRMLIWQSLPQTPEVRKLVNQDAKLLAPTITKDGLAAYYGARPDLPPLGEKGDLSNSQIVTLGLWAASYCELETKKDYWLKTDKTWRSMQLADGSWDYAPGAKPPFIYAITAAGLATLYITQEMGDDRAETNGNPIDPHTEKARSWLAKNFNEYMTLPPHYGRLVYGLYVLERAGVAGGYKYLGDRDWFQEGCAWLLKNQKPDGSWSERIGSTNLEPENAVVDTGLALLFFAHGRAPFAINKLEYATQKNGKPELRWNQRPRDVANVVRWVGRSQERTYNWQIIDLSRSQQDLAEAPVLYISGDRTLSFSDAEIAKLRTFVEDGGLIVGNADAGAAAFTQGFRALGTRLFPQMEFRPLPDSHPIFKGQQFPAAKWKRKPRFEGLSNGVRELMLLIPNDDFSRAYQTRAWDQSAEPFQAMANILLYATDKQPPLSRDALAELAVAPPKAASPMRVAVLKYQGIWNPEPAAWRQMDLHLRRTDQRGVDASIVELGQGKLDNTIPLAHLSGTTAFTLDDKQLAELKAYLDKGGTLLIDAAGGAAPFNTSARAMLDKLYPGTAVKPIGADDPLYAGITPRWRPYAALLNVPQTPISVMLIGDRRAVYFSDNDLSAALAGIRHDGIVGYDIETTRKLVGNLLSQVASKPQ
jgi:hypothetical protein